MRKSIPSTTHTTPQSTMRKRTALAEALAFKDRLEGFHDGLAAALAASDVSALQVLVPRLSEQEADALIYHTARQEKARAAGLYNYGADTWPEEVPIVVMVATVAVRSAFLQVWRPGLSEDDAHAVLRTNIEHELAWGEFWRWPIHRLRVSDLREADALQREQEAAPPVVILRRHRKALGRAYCAARYWLRQEELPFELLAAYARRRKS